MSTQEGEQFARDNGLVFMETSAKTSHNVEEVGGRQGPFLLDLLAMPEVSPFSALLLHQVFLLHGNSFCAFLLVVFVCVGRHSSTLQRRSTRRFRMGSLMSRMKLMASRLGMAQVVVLAAAEWMLLLSDLAAAEHPLP